MPPTAPWQAIHQGSQDANQQYIASERDALNQFYSDYNIPWWKTGRGANRLYADALGLGGPEGMARARGAFQTSPGYEFALQQGLQGVDRGASAKGFLGSGNAAMALNDYAQGMANQEYGNWLSNLGGLGAQGMAAAQGRQARQGAMADINMWGGGRRGESILDSSQLIGRLWQDAIEKEKDRQIRKQQSMLGLIGDLSNLIPFMFGRRTRGSSNYGF